MTLKDLVPHARWQTQNAAGMWVRAMHEPFRGGLFDRMRDAWAVLRGKDVFAVRWPTAGEYERVMARRGDDGDRFRKASPRHPKPVTPPSWAL